MKPILFGILIFYCFQLKAQISFQLENSLAVDIPGQMIDMPFAGGINAAQIQQMDISGDGQEALVLWDRNSENLLVFEKKAGKYIHNPDLTYFFPKDILGFLILADFDEDGKKDLFTGSSFGIKVFKNTTPSGAEYPQWELYLDFLRLDNNANLQINLEDIPSIMDFDADGDLDIVTFNFASGDYLEYYKNTSVERKGQPDLDGFSSPVRRWGGFEFCGCGNFVFGQTCAGNPISKIQTEGENFKVEHAGGHSILFHDFNGDGNLDLLMGQDECSNLFYLANEGTNENPDFQSFSMNLPQLNALPEFPIFHGAYMLDQDLLVTSYSTHTAFQLGADFSRNIYHYQNGSKLTTDGFLQEDMVDFGENTRPFFRGNDLSGGLIVTANSLTENGTVGKANYFSLRAGKFTLGDRDYLNLSLLQLIDLQYQEFRPVKHLPSLFISGVEVVNFTPVRKLFWSASLDGKEFLEIAIPNLQLRGNDQLEFFNLQGESFLLLAKETGELIRFKVTFNPIPEIQLLDRNYLGFTDNPAHRDLNVHIIETSNGLDLFAVDQNGELVLLQDFPNNSIPDTVSIQLPENHLVNTRLGRNSWISSIPSTFGNTTDLILGSKAGGLVYLKDATSGDISPGLRNPQIKIYPNPSPRQLTVIASEPGEISLINTLGQIIFEGATVQEYIPLEVQGRNLSNGIYFLKWVGKSGESISNKVVIQKW